MRGLLALIALPMLIAASPVRHDNRAIITEFARLFYVERDVKTAFETYVVPDYIQHNPGLTDGRDAAIAAVSADVC